MNAGPLGENGTGRPSEESRAVAGDLDDLPVEQRLRASVGDAIKPRQLATVPLEREERARRLAEMVPDDQVADPADDHPGGQAECSRVHDLEEPVSVPSHEGIGEEDRPGDPTEETDPSVVDLEHVERMRGEVGPVRDDVEDAGADDRSDQSPE